METIGRVRLLLIPSFLALLVEQLDHVPGNAGGVQRAKGLSGGGMSKVQGLVLF